MDQCVGCEPEPVQAQTKCRKCGSNPFILLDKVHLECKQCFLETCNRKFRATIGKSKLLTDTHESILVAHSGGASSSALLDLIKNVIDYEGRREPKFFPSIIVVETSVLDSSRTTNLDVNRATRRKEFRSILSDTHVSYPTWPLYWTTLEMSMRPSLPPYMIYEPNGDLEDSKYDTLLNDDDSRDLFYRKLNQMDLTDKQKYVQSTLAELLGSVADRINSSFSDPKQKFKFVFTGSSATHLATNLLVDVILGHGATIRSTVDICDKSHSVPIFRPLREFSKKEIAFYLRGRELEYHVKADLSTCTNRKASIQRATESFLSKLYVDYPSTYSTLLRTGNKMQD